MGDAAIVVVHDGQGRVLTVSRDGNPADLGFPGGHVEEGETAEHAALRELLEETGVKGVELTKLFEADRPEGAGKVHVYRTMSHGAFGGFKPEPGEHVRWAHPGELTAPACTFAPFALAHPELFAMSDATKMDLGPGDVHVPSLGPIGPDPKTLPKPRWPLSDPKPPVQMISPAKRKSLPDEKFALPEQKKYPIDTPARTRTAAARLEQQKGSLTPGDYAKAKARIARAAKKFGIHSEYNASDKVSAAPATSHIVPHAHVHAVIPHGGELHVRHLTDKEFQGHVELTEKQGDGPVWNQIACVGAFKGHHSGPFALTPKVFEEIVHNFNREGKKPIPIDFEHASELPAEKVAATGAPANGWITALENRGAAGLFGLVEWLPEGRELVRSQKYKFFSPAIRFDNKDRVTGQPIGARLSSGALTNTPFLTSMPALAAKDTPMPEQTVTLTTFAYSAHEYMPKLRACMGMHELATGEEMKDHLDRLKAHLSSANGNADAMVGGVQLAKYLHPLREFTHGSQMTATFDDVFQRCEALIDNAIERHEITEHAGPVAEPHEVETAAFTDTSEDTTMSDTKALTDKVSELTVMLSAKEADVTRLTAENAALVKWKGERETKELDDEVAYTLTVHKDKVAHMGENPQVHLLSMLKANPEGFRAMFPKSVDPNQAYLLSTHTPTGAGKAGGTALSAGGFAGLGQADLAVLNNEDVRDTTQRLMSEKKLSFIAAGQEAMRLHKQLRAVG